MKEDAEAITSLVDLPGSLLRSLLSPRSCGDGLAEAARGAFDSEPIDWARIVEESQRHGIGVLIATRLQELSRLDKIDSEMAGRLAADIRHAALQSTLQRQDALLIHEKLSELDIPHAFLKGFAYREQFYEPWYVRAGADVDILIDPNDIEIVRDTILRAGFAQASRTPDFRNFRIARRSEIERTERSHYELAQFARTHILRDAPEWLFEPAFTRGPPFAFEKLQDGPAFHAVFDVHWALHFIFAKENPLEIIEHFSTGEDGQLPGLSLEWNFLFSAFKLYFESFDKPGRGLHQLIDIYALLSAAGPDLEWTWIDEMVRHFGFEAALFYTTSAAEQLSGSRLVPDEFHVLWSSFGEIGERRPTDDGPRDLDFGDFLPSMFGRRLACAYVRDEKDDSS